MKRFPGLVLTVTLALIVIPREVTNAAPKAGGIHGKSGRFSRNAVGQQGVAAITGWPPRGPVQEISCPAVNVCVAVGSLPEPVPLPAKPPSKPPGGVIARTDDGGMTWTVRTYPQTYFGRIACPSPTQCYFLTGYGHGRTATGALGMTPDGGQTWQLHPLPAGTNPQAIACPGLSTCFLWDIVGNAGRTPRDPPTFTVSMLTTHNGGRTWKRSRTVAQRPDFNSGSLACPTIRVCYVYNGLSVIVKTENGGKTWRALPGTNMGALSGVPATTLANLGSIACPSALVCYTAQGDAKCQCDAWGPYGTIFGTQDGGKHWVQLYRARGHNYPEGTITCPGNNVCYAIGATQRDVPADQIVLSTKDGGRTWTTHKVAAGPFLTCPSVTVCYAGTHAGVGFRTIDGGTTWQHLP